MGGIAGGRRLLRQWMYWPLQDWKDLVAQDDLLDSAKQNCPQRAMWAMKMHAAEVGWQRRRQAAAEAVDVSPAAGYRSHRRTAGRRPGAH